MGTGFFDAEAIARVCHEANRTVQVLTGDPAPSPAWDDAPEWQRQSAVDGVAAAREGISGEDQHEAWCEHKRADGWVYGATKDADARTHPCLVPYSELPVEQRAKDELFVAVVRALSGW